MQAIILNSGIGKRMGDFTADKCKCMVEISNGKNIFDKQVGNLIECGITKICVTTGPFADSLESYARENYPDVDFTFVNNSIYDRTNYIYSIYLARDILQDDILLLHGDLVFERSVLQDAILSKKSVMVIDSEKPLPFKDFKAVIKESKIIKIDINDFESAYSAQPLYKLLKKDWLIWLNEIKRFCTDGITDVYAENAFNCVSDKMNLLPLDICGRVCFEIDDENDLAYAKKIYPEAAGKTQTVYEGHNSVLNIKNITGAKKTMVVCDSAFEKFPAYVRDAVKSISPDIIYFKDFSPNPVYSDIMSGVSLFVKESCDFIVSVGGGSAIDTAKCINILEAGNGLLNKARCRHLAISTTAGTGSESTKFAVLYKDGEKLSVEHDDILPDYIILDPVFLETLPVYHKKSSMLDALCQSIESIWAKGATDESKEYAKKAISIIINNIERYLKSDKESMLLMLQAANLSGKAINISKTTAAHAMSYQLSAIFGIAHGHAVALCLPYIWEHLLNEYVKLPDYKILKNALDDLAEVTRADKNGDAIRIISDIFINLDISHDFDYNDIIVKKLADSVNIQRLNNHPVELSKDALENIYRKILFNHRNEEK